MAWGTTLGPQRVFVFVLLAIWFIVEETQRSIWIMVNSDDRQTSVLKQAERLRVDSRFSFVSI